MNGKNKVFIFDITRPHIHTPKLTTMKTIGMIFLILLSSGLCSQTFIADRTEVSGTWSKKGSPYYVDGQAIIPEGKTLVIKPGTVVKFRTCNVHDINDDGFNCGYLRVNGILVAKGKSSDFITFTRDGNTGFWGIVYIDSRQSGNILEYCRVEYSYFVRHIITLDNATGGFTFHSSTGTVRNCLLVDNGWTGINCKQDSRVMVENCVIANNNYGIECNSGSTAMVTSTIIWQNNQAVFINGEGSVEISYSLYQDNEPEDGMVDNGFTLWEVDPMLTSDYRLMESSPCIKRGIKGKNIGLSY